MFFIHTVATEVLFEYVLQLTRHLHGVVVLLLADLPGIEHLLDLLTRIAPERVFELLKLLDIPISMMPSVRASCSTRSQS